MITENCRNHLVQLFTPKDQVSQVRGRTRFIRMSWGEVQYRQVNCEIGGGTKNKRLFLDINELRPIGECFVKSKTQGLVKVSGVNCVKHPMGRTGN